MQAGTDTPGMRILGRFGLVPSEPRQALRIYRYLMAVATALLLAVLLLGGAAFGLVRPAAAAWSSGVIVALSVLFYAVFRAGLNLRFRDPGLTFEMCALSVLVLTGILYHAQAMRGVLGVVYAVVLMFGVFRLSVIRMLALAALALGAQAALIVAVSARDPHADVALEWMQFAVLAVVLPVFSLLAGYVRSLNRTLSRSNRELAESEARFGDFARASGDWFWETDAAGRFTWISGGAQAATGALAAEDLGRTRVEIAGQGDDVSSPRWTEHLQALAACAPFRDFRYRRQTSIGERWISSSGVPVFDAAGNFRGYRGTGADITARVAEERRVREVTEQLTAALDKSNESFSLCDAEGRFVFVNQRFRDLVPGIEHLTAPGKPYLDYLRGAVAAGLLPEAAGREEEWIAARMAQRRAAQGSVSRHFRGNRCWLVSDRRLPDGSTISSALDITKWHRVEEELIASRRLLEQVIDAIPMSIFAKDLDSNYVIVNRYMADFFGTTKEALQQHHTSELPSRDATRQQSLRDDRWVYDNRKTLTHETWIHRPDGTPVPYHSSKIPLFDAGGALTGLLGINRDITEQLQAQRKIEEINATLEDRVRERTAQLESANRELEAFSYSVSHDLKAPLRSIDAAVGILRIKHGEQIPAEADTYLTRISQNALRMARLIEGLLEFARLSRQALNRRELRPEEVVRQVLQGCDEAIRERGVVVKVHALPPCHADPLLLRQVFENLVSNALKYSAQAQPPVIEIGAAEHGGEVAYYVRDNGVGFDMAYVHKLFGVFERLHAPEQFEGTGIGLALVRRVVERHGGRVRAEGAPGSGATFYFTLGRPAAA